ncbi:MAG TPA: WecB/TagA/CpsF family glycosyltransferase [Candidatus Limnocylindrales bacterium]|nr:WecB/TagA/CpsF family glycosyltransferase [Candidatus Limnocylindrales bacterium]
MRVDCLDTEEALELIERFATSGTFHQVATVNPEFVMRAQSDREFARVLASADLCLPDGTGVVWAARRQGCALSAPVAGVDLVEPLAEMCVRRGLKLFLLGAQPGVAGELADRLTAEHPRLQVASHPGAPDPAHDDETLRLIGRQGTDVLLVAYGAPAQELWIDRMRERLGVGVAIGVGGAFDYLTGRVPRAPEWMRRSGLEWLHRLVRQPWRVRRMAVLPVYALRVLRPPK